MDPFVELLSKLPPLFGAFGEVLSKGWPTAGLFAVLAAWQYVARTRADKARLAEAKAYAAELAKEKDARLGDVKEQAKFADEMRQVIAVLGRQAVQSPAVVVAAPKQDT